MGSVDTTVRLSDDACQESRSRLLSALFRRSTSGLRRLWPCLHGLLLHHLLHVGLLVLRQVRSDSCYVERPSLDRLGVFQEAQVTGDMDGMVFFREEERRHR